MTPTLMYVNSVACVVIFIWSVWCIFCQRVHDGLFGKIIFCMIALSSLGLIFYPSEDYEYSHRVAVTLNVSFALLGIRHIIIKYLWPKFVRSLLCEDCPRKIGTK